MAAPPHCQNPSRRGTPAGLPLPQRPPPPVQPKLAMTGPAELVTCDQTIEHTVRYAKQQLAWTTRGSARPSRPTGGPGWCWPPPPSCAWPARSPATNGCRGSGPDPSRDCHPTGYGAGFRGCCAHSARRRVRRNPPGAPQAGPGPLLGTCRAVPSDQKASDEAQEEGHQDRQGRLTGPRSAPTRPPQISGPTRRSHKG
jgi:hypothetical protein